MTCIVGMVHPGGVILGGDSAGVNGYYGMQLRANPKVFVNGPFVMGFTSSFRMGQLLQYKLTVPKPLEGQDVVEYMATTFIDTVRACLENGGFATKHNGEESGGTFLVGFRNRLFEVQADYDVGELAAPYAAVGCGADIALGALAALAAHAPGLARQDQLTMALDAAEQFSAGVRRPFHFAQIVLPSTPHQPSVA